MDAPLPGTHSGLIHPPPSPPALLPPGCCRERRGRGSCVSEADRRPGAGRPPSGARGHGCLEAGVTVCRFSGLHTGTSHGTGGRENAGENLRASPLQMLLPAPGQSTCSRGKSCCGNGHFQEELGLRSILALTPRSRASRSELKRQPSTFPGTFPFVRGRASLGSSLQAHRVGRRECTRAWQADRRGLLVTDCQSPPPCLPGAIGTELAVPEQWCRPACLPLSHEPKAVLAKASHGDHSSTATLSSSSSWSPPPRGARVSAPSRPPWPSEGGPAPWISLQFLAKAGRPRWPWTVHTGVQLTGA